MKIILMLVLIAFPAFAIGAEQCTPLFNTASTYKTGAGARAMVHADVNLDGHEDLAVLNPESSTLSILLGNGDGTFQPRLNHNTNEFTYHLEVGEFNSDNIPDFVIATVESRYISILLGDGHGSFQGGTSLQGIETVSTAASDFNKDGHGDLASGDVFGTSIRVWLGNGDGSFQSGEFYPSGGCGWGLQSGDFNDDGFEDLVSSDLCSDNVDILLGNGDGTFGPPVHYSLGSQASEPNYVEVGHLNSDSFLDLLVASEAGGSFSVLLGNGDGTFQAAQIIFVGSRQSWISVADLNLDGFADAVIGGPNSDVAILLGNGDGTFQSPYFYATGGSSTSVSLADFDEDTNIDLAVTDVENARVVVLLGNGDGTFKGARSFPPSVGNTLLVTDDFNVDGKPDLVTGTTNSVLLRLGNGDGTFQTGIGSPAGITSGYGASGLLDANTLPDLVTVNETDDTISVMLGNANGSFNAPMVFPVGNNPKSIAVADFSADLFIDIASANLLSNDISILLGNGDGTFGLSRSLPVGLQPIFVVADDLNTDNFPDLVVANSGSNDISILLGNGDGTFQTSTNLLVGTKPVQLTTGLFNDDAVKDLVVLNQSSKTISVLFGQGNGLFLPPVHYVAGLKPLWFVAADLNQDGLTDIGVANIIQSRPYILVFLLKSDGTLEPPLEFSIAADMAATVGDYNVDGLSDLALVNIASVRSLPGIEVVLGQQAIRIAPEILPPGKLGAIYLQQLSADGGSLPYTFALVVGTLPPGLTLSINGLISGTPTSTGEFRFAIRATDSVNCNGNRQYVINVDLCPTIVVNPPSLPGGAVGTTYDQDITASGGASPYTFAVASGALPDGLTLSPAGTLSGTPTVAGSFTFIIATVDSAGCSGTRSYNINVVINCPAMLIDPASLPGATVGTPYIQTITASGGAAPYTFGLTSGVLPNGLTLSPDGTLSGTPTTEGSFTFVITATDTLGCTGAQSYNIDVISLGTCLFCDDFEDGILDIGWTYLKPDWTESNGNLIGAPTGRKAIAVASPVFAGCSACSMEAQMKSAGGAGNRVWFLAWYQDKKNAIELLMNEESDRWILKQKSNGHVVAKTKGASQIDTDVSYTARVVFDGEQFQVFVNNSLLITMQKGVGTSPIGTVGFQVKNTTGSYAFINVK